MQQLPYLQVPLVSFPDGSLRIEGTEISLEQIVSAFERGVIADEIAVKFKDLSLSDVFLVLSYYLRNRSDVESYLESRSLAKKRPKPAA